MPGEGITITRFFQGSGFFASFEAPAYREEETPAMEGYEKNGIVFETDEVSLPSEADTSPSGTRGILRRLHRLPAEALHSLTISIKDRDYPVVNVSPESIAIQVTDPGRFSAGERLPSMTLRVTQREFVLQGRVIHLSPHDSGEYICGIEFIETDPEVTESIDRYVRRSRDEFLSKK